MKTTAQTFELNMGPSNATEKMDLSEYIMK